MLDLEGQIQIVPGGGQVGPILGSFDAGWGTTRRARVSGEKKAREIRYLNVTFVE